MSISTVAIVEDNRHDADNLVSMLEKHFPALKIMAVLGSYDDAVRELSANRPDLLFLDINLPGNYTAFDILKACAPIGFNIIFTTAYDQYAIDAIRASALDYLLKPFDSAMLTETMQRVFTKMSSHSFQISSQQSAIEQAKERFGLRHQKIMVHSGGSILFIESGDVIRLEASGAYSIFILSNGQKIISSHNLQHYENELSNELFFRTHRSFIINMHKVKSLKRSNNGGLIVLSDNAEINITKEKLDQFLRLFKKEI